MTQNWPPVRLPPRASRWAGSPKKRTGEFANASKRHFGSEPTSARMTASAGAEFPKTARPSEGTQ
jgi:hypothetical protein